MVSSGIQLQLEDVVPSSGGERLLFCRMTVGSHLHNAEQTRFASSAKYGCAEDPFGELRLHVGRFSKDTVPSLRKLAA